MAEELLDYETRKEAIRRSRPAVSQPKELEHYAEDPIERPRQVGAMDVVGVGTKVVIGTGVGLLAGMATIAVVASAGELILAGVVTKIAGVVGGALGLSLGLGKLKKKKTAS